MNETVTEPLLEETIVLASKDVLAAELGAEASLLNVKSGIYFTLNSVGASVWRHIQEATSLATIKKQLLDEYDVDSACCERDLRRLISELHTLGLIEVISA